jgi:ribosomal protein S15P/S13E
VSNYKLKHIKLLFSFQEIKRRGISQLTQEGNEQLKPHILNNSKSQHGRRNLKSYENQIPLLKLIIIYVLKITIKNQVLYYTPVIPATQEADQEDHGPRPAQAKS